MVFKARRCFNCLGTYVLVWLKIVRKNVFVADIRVRIFANIFSCCTSALPQLYLKSFGNNQRVDKEEKDVRNHSVAQSPSFSVRSVEIGSTKAALPMLAARVINLQNGKSKLVYCQQDGDSQ